MSTHSTHLSEVADIGKVNVTKKFAQIAVVMKPTTGLSEFGKKELGNKDFIASLTRYLDAKRSVLLFSKGVVLVEGDGEEILIPALIKEVLGVSLDELGIGLINVGSVAFENIACIFDETRLQRNCAIITDSDAVVDGATKSKPEAAKRGQSRKEKLDKLFAWNPYVEVFYAPHTLEVDFAESGNNKNFIRGIIKTAYKTQDKIDEYTETLVSGTDAERYDAVITLANHVRKGWYASLLAAAVNCAATIPKYILEAIAFAAHDIIDEQVIWKMVQYSFSGYDETDNQDLKNQMEAAELPDEQAEFISAFRKAFPSDMASIFLNEVEWE
jgi:predicted ATP-dependent endonuclease of OLD family